MSPSLAASVKLARDSSRNCGRSHRANAPFALSAVVFALLLLSSCGHNARKSTAHVPAPPQPARIGSSETGTASWYGNPYHGRQTASGEIYDMEMLTAAHRTLPFQTWLDVTNLSNGKHVEVRITDRGPFVDGRIIDLSLAAAREIDMIQTGIARVRLKVIAPPKDLAQHRTAPIPTTPTALAQPVSSEPAEQPPDPPSTVGYGVQAGAFADRNRAEALRASIVKQFGTADIERVAGPSGRPLLWHVLVGHGLTFEEATALAVKVRAIAGAALIVPDNRTSETNPPAVQEIP